MPIFMLQKFLQVLISKFNFPDQWAAVKVHKPFQGKFYKSLIQGAVVPNEWNATPAKWTQKSH